MFDQLKQIQNLRAQADQIKKALAEETVTGSGAWNKIKITMDGNQEAKKVEIDPELLNDKEKLEQGVTEAINDTVKKVQKIMAQKMSQFGGF